MSPVAPYKLLTIGGSDSGGAAGIQADLKTFSALGVYGMSVLTVVTAQNSVAVAGVHALPPPFIAAQLTSVLADYGAHGAKTGFIGSAAAIDALAPVLVERPLPHLVIDPVLVNQRGAAMFAPEVAAAYRAQLFPLATLVTPNRAEAALLTQQAVDDLPAMAAAGMALLAAGPAAVLVTGGRDGGQAVDVLCTPAGPSFFSAPWIETANTHGSGDTLSAALVAYLAAGYPLREAIAAAREVTRLALSAAAGWRLGAGHGPLCHWTIPALRPPNQP